MTRNARKKGATVRAERRAAEQLKAEIQFKRDAKECHANRTAGPRVRYGNFKDPMYAGYTRRDGERKAQEVHVRAGIASGELANVRARINTDISRAFRRTGLL
jgi:hypothetical protein